VIEKEDMIISDDYLDDWWKDDDWMGSEERGEKIFDAVVSGRLTPGAYEPWSPYFLREISKEEIAEYARIGHVRFMARVKAMNEAIEADYLALKNNTEPPPDKSAILSGTKNPLLTPLPSEIEEIEKKDEAP